MKLNPTQQKQAMHDLS